jgi:hypothetical protein
VLEEEIRTVGAMGEIAKGSYTVMVASIKLVLASVRRTTQLPAVDGAVKIPVDEPIDPPPDTTLKIRGSSPPLPEKVKALLVTIAIVVGVKSRGFSTEIVAVTASFIASVTVITAVVAEAGAL